MSKLFNLKTVPSNLLQAHLDRMKDSEVFLAQLCAGEVLEGRHESSGIIARNITNLRTSREAICSHHNRINGLED